MMDHMKPDTEVIKAEAQQTLDDLFAESLIPFRLNAREVTSLGMKEYVIRFHDSRLRSIDISWKNGESFKEVFRSAVLKRVARLGGPQPNSKPDISHTGLVH
jgi:hypothetical protein